MRAETEIFAAVVEGFRRAPAPGPEQLGEVAHALSDVEHLIAHACESAEELLNGEEFYIKPMMRFYRRDSGHVAEIEFDALDDSDVSGSRFRRAGCRAVIEQADIDGYFVFAEAWGAPFRPDPEINAMPLNQRSDRQEMLFVSAAIRGDHVLRIFPVLRDGETVRLGEEHRARTLHSNPLFTDLFKRTVSRKSEAAE